MMLGTCVCQKAHRAAEAVADACAVMVPTPLGPPSINAEQTFSLRPAVPCSPAGVTRMVAGRL